MQFQYDEEADAIYIRLRGGTYSHGKDLDHERRIDYDADGAVLGVEFLCATEGVLLDEVPEAERVAAILKRFQIKVLA